jgi:hypothetical protein
MKRDTRFKAGFSGNPRGRKPNAKSKSGDLRRALAADLPAILASVIEAAKAGDVGAASLVLSRCLAPVRPSALPVDLPALAAAQSIAAQSKVIRAAVSAGLLSPTDAATLVGLLQQASEIERNNDDDETSPEPVTINRRTADMSIPE